MVKSAFDGCVGRVLASNALQVSGVESPVRTFHFVTFYYLLTLIVYCQYFFLVGGFGDSPYLRASLGSQVRTSGRLTTSNSPG
jgi:hypothetical protein